MKKSEIYYRVKNNKYLKKVKWLLSELGEDVSYLPNKLHPSDTLIWDKLMFIDGKWNLCCRSSKITVDISGLIDSVKESKLEFDSDKTKYEDLTSSGKTTHTLCIYAEDKTEPIFRFALKR